MTANQIAYQANLIKQQEADSNRMKAEAARQKSELEVSEHIRNYGGIYQPNRTTYMSPMNIGVGLKDMGDIVDIASTFVQTPFGVLKSVKGR